MKNSQYCFCFVSQSGDLEIQSLLLAASLSKNVQCSYEMIAAIPLEYGELKETTYTIFRELNVKTINISNPIKKTYKIGNKLSCLEKASKITRARYVIFLDTDIVCNRNFHEVKNIEKYDISARVVGEPCRKWWKNESKWKPLYDMFGLQLPKERILSETQELILPFFNAGFIAIHKNSAFPAKWRELSQIIYENFYNEASERKKKKKKKHFTDQLSIPIAIRALELNYQCLDHKYNSAPFIKEGAIFLHYHNLNELFINYPECTPLLSHILKKYPQLADMLAPKE